MPLKLILHCEECPYARTGYFPAIIIKGDRHADKLNHTLTARRLDGSLFEVLGADKCREVVFRPRRYL